MGLFLAIAGATDVVLAVAPGTSEAAHPGLGQIPICNTCGYAFDVYAGGTDRRTDDFQGVAHECIRWDPAAPGT